ncbi:hypothetical protein LshimejAT787_0501040 [Lyophyllum shimeji]|uniref:Transmembrane protein n=1 Tax=Lyophyllum shimeji TaxID=47721 RepID=A0A9P3PML0_LYOSH|nr:hypothetical protein LshimejAT787_0501040 [Lyophyllum shimeji]
MFFLAVLLFGVLAIGPQVVQSLAFKFELSEVKQCEPVSITFVGNSSASAVPMFLTLVPFNSSPISIPIPNAAANTSGVYVTFFPLEAGTTFVASLDDATGENVARVSDIIRVLPSPTNNTTCLPASKDAAKPTLFTLDNSTFSQCENFTLTYNRTVLFRAPSIRFYSPRGPSRLLNLTSDDAATGTATYLLSFVRNFPVVLVFDDGSSHRQSSALMTVGGDSSSSTGCLLLPKSGNDGNSVQNMTRTTTTGISRPVIIGSAAGGGVVVLISIFMLVFVLRERRRRQRENVEFNPTLIEKGLPPSPPLSRHSPSPRSATINEKNLSPGFVKDPPYTAEKFLSPTTAYYPRQSGQSMASWAQPTPEDQRSPRRTGSDAYKIQEDRLSLNSLDIEGILNLAALQSSRSSRQGAEPAPLGPALGPVEPAAQSPRLEVPTRFPARRHPSDVPVGPASFASALTLSSVVDPFTDNGTNQPGSARGPYRQPSVDSLRPPPGAVIGLPLSPRNGQRLMRQRGSDLIGRGQDALRSSNRSTKDSMGDYYLIAR